MDNSGGQRRNNVPPESGNSSLHGGDDDVSHLFMSVCLHKDTLGIAFYNCETTELNVAELHTTNDDIDMILQQLKYENNPRIIIVTSTIMNNDNLAHSLKRSCSNESSSQYPLKILKQSAFEYNKACQLLLECINISGSSNNSNQNRDKALHINSLINIEEVQMVRAIGGLFFYLQNNRDEYTTLLTSEDTGQSNTRFSVHKINRITLDDFMYIEPITFWALQIFNQELHPSIIKGRGRAKEGFSLMQI